MTVVVDASIMAEALDPSSARRLDALDVLHALQDLDHLEKHGERL